MPQPAISASVRAMTTKSGSTAARCAARILRRAPRRARARAARRRRSCSASGRSLSSMQMAGDAGALELAHRAHHVDRVAVAVVAVGDDRDRAPSSTMRPTASSVSVMVRMLASGTALHGRDPEAAAPRWRRSRPPPPAWPRARRARRRRSPAARRSAARATAAPASLLLLWRQLCSASDPQKNACDTYTIRRRTQPESGAGARAKSA